MPLYINKDNVVERITFNKPVTVHRREYENSWWQELINACWRGIFGSK